jgi:hypothetical protein
MNNTETTYHAPSELKIGYVHLKVADSDGNFTMEKAMALSKALDLNELLNEAE